MPILQLWENSYYYYSYNYNQRMSKIENKLSWYVLSYEPPRSNYNIKHNYWYKKSFSTSLSPTVLMTQRGVWIVLLYNCIFKYSMISILIYNY